MWHYPRRLEWRWVRQLQPQQEAALDLYVGGHNALQVRGVPRQNHQGVANGERRSQDLEGGGVMVLVPWPPVLGEEVEDLVDKEYAPLGPCQYPVRPLGCPCLRPRVNQLVLPRLHKRRDGHGPNLLTQGQQQPCDIGLSAAQPAGQDEVARPDSRSR